MKEIVNFLCHICKVVNYEINYIEAKLTNAAERTISTYAFALAFKSILEAKIGKEKENESKQKKVKEKNFEYFLQKVENRKLTKGNWDRKEMRKGEKIIASKFAGDFLAGVWREINGTCKRSIEEEYFYKTKDELSHRSILLQANARITEMLLHPNEPVDGHNFVVQFICNRTQCLKSLFQEEGGEDNELAMLDGLATATTKCGWKSGLGIKNLIIHIYVEPTKENFDIFSAKGRCTHGFDFDWERDIAVRMKELNIEYKDKRLVSSSHPDHPGSIDKGYSPSKIKINSGDDVYVAVKVRFQPKRVLAENAL